MNGFNLNIRSLLMSNTALWVCILVVLSAEAQQRNQLFLEYTPGTSGPSVVAGYERSLHVKELKGKLFNGRHLVQRSRAGLFQISGGNTHLIVNSLTGFRFWNKKTGLGIEPLSLGLGFNHLRYSDVAYEYRNGVFTEGRVQYRGYSVSLHAQVLAVSYTLPLEKLPLVIRFAPEAVAFFNLKRYDPVTFDRIRLPVPLRSFPISLNYTF